MERTHNSVSCDEYKVVIVEYSQFSTYPSTILTGMTVGTAIEQEPNNFKLPVFATVTQGTVAFNINIGTTIEQEPSNFKVPVCATLAQSTGIMSAP